MKTQTSRRTAPAPPTAATWSQTVDRDVPGSRRGPSPRHGRPARETSVPGSDSREHPRMIAHRLAVVCARMAPLRAGGDHPRPWSDGSVRVLGIGGVGRPDGCGGSADGLIDFSARAVLCRPSGLIPPPEDDTPRDRGVECWVSLRGVQEVAAPHSETGFRMRRRRHVRQKSLPTAPAHRSMQILPPTSSQERPPATAPQPPGRALEPPLTGAPHAAVIATSVDQVAP
jgi:hypothetical protein